MPNFNGFVRDIDAPIEFLEHVLSDIKKPKLKAKPAKPKLTGLNLINSLEFGLYVLESSRDSH